jgi:tetratricopeptide (TPR) repeat protein
MCVWTVFSGFFVTCIANRIKDRCWPAGLAAVAGAVCVGIVSNLNFFVVKNPEYRPHFNLGFIYETQTKYDRALEEYSAALNLVKKTEPRDVKLESELYARLGNVHLVLNDLASARERFSQAIAVNSDLGPAYSYLGTLYEKEGQSDQAIKMFRRAIEINPWDVVSIHNFGLFYLNSMRFDEAIARFKRVIELAPEHSGAHNNLAYIYGTQGKYDLMEAEARKAVYYNPQGASARYNLASLYLNTGRIEEAIAQYRAITQTSPRDSSNAYNQLGIIYAQRNDLKRAIDNWQKALEIDPKNGDAQMNIRNAMQMIR